jgi:hypothetical protein
MLMDTIAREFKARGDHLRRQVESPVRPHDSGVAAEDHEEPPLDGHLLDDRHDLSLELCLELGLQVLDLRLRVLREALDFHLLPLDLLLQRCLGRLVHRVGALRELLLVRLKSLVLLGQLARPLLVERLNLRRVALPLDRVIGDLLDVDVGHLGALGERQRRERSWRLRRRRRGRLLSRRGLRGRLNLARLGLLLGDGLARQEKQAGHGGQSQHSHRSIPSR